MYKYLQRFILLPRDKISAMRGVTHINTRRFLNGFLRIGGKPNRAAGHTRDIIQYAFLSGHPSPHISD